VQELQQFVQRSLPTLNPQQTVLYDAVMNSIINSLGSPFFLHSGGGCGKTYLANLIATSVHARGEIVLSVASTGLAPLLLPDQYCNQYVISNDQYVVSMWSVMVVVSHSSNQ